MPGAGRLDDILDFLGDGVFLADASGAYVDVNRAGCAQFGYTRAEFLRLTLAEILDPAEWSRLGEALASYVPGEVSRSEWLFRRKDGTTFPGELVGGMLPDGRYQSVVRDLGWRQSQQEAERAMIQESAHRTKNILALVQAMLRQTQATEPALFKEAFQQRVASLARSHELFLAAAWGAIDLAELVAVQTAPFCSATHRRCHASGPHLLLSSPAAQSIGMAVHELATNAAKYGALHGPEGRVDITWQIAPGGDPAITLAWRESGGPPVSPPGRLGFGSRVIGRLMESAFRARTVQTFEPEGMTWTMTCPLAAVAAARAADDPAREAAQQPEVVLVIPDDDARQRLDSDLAGAGIPTLAVSSWLEAAGLCRGRGAIRALVVAEELVDAATPPQPRFPLPEDHIIILTSGAATRAAGACQTIEMGRSGQLITRLLTLCEPSVAAGQRGEVAA
jgi:PAS domain S-box-containing protein